MGTMTPSHFITKLKEVLLRFVKYEDSNLFRNELKG